MDWAFCGVTRHPDRSSAASQLTARLLKGVTYLNDRPVGGRCVPRFSIPQQDRTPILQTILKRPHRFMYKDTTWCVEVTETYKWTATAMAGVPVVESSVLAFQHDWDEQLNPLDDIDATRPWTQDESMLHILPGPKDSVEDRLDDLLEFAEDLRLLLTRATGRDRLE